MAFGLSSGAVSLIGAGAGLVGGALSSKKGASATQQAQIDPNLQPLLYGAEGTTGEGLLNRGASLFNSQADQGGLNNYQRAGLEAQRQVLSNSGYTSGYEQQRQLGMGLLGGGVAANPFSTGQTQLMSANNGLLSGFSQQSAIGQTPAAQQQAQVIAPQLANYTPIQADTSSLEAFNTPITAYTPAPAPAPVAAAPVAAPEKIDQNFAHLLDGTARGRMMYDGALRDYQSSMSGGG